MTLSARSIQSPRQHRRCCECNRYIVGPQIRAYGMADAGDKPYTLYMHPDCAYHWNDDKVKAALRIAKEHLRNNHVA